VVKFNQRGIEHHTFSSSIEQDKLNKWRSSSKKEEEYEYRQERKDLI